MSLSLEEQSIMTKDRELRKERKGTWRMKSRRREGPRIAGMTRPLILRMILSEMKNDEIVIVTIDVPKGEKRREEDWREATRCGRVSSFVKFLP